VLREKRADSDEEARAERRPLRPISSSIRSHDHFHPAGIHPAVSCSASSPFNSTRPPSAPTASGSTCRRRRRHRLRARRRQAQSGSCLIPPHRRFPASARWRWLSPMATRSVPGADSVKYPSPGQISESRRGSRPRDYVISAAMLRLCAIAAPRNMCKGARNERQRIAVRATRGGARNESEAHAIRKRAHRIVPRNGPVRGWQH
jgi:hypothetical protein